MSAETKTERVLRDVLNSDNLRDFLGGDVVNNAMKWRFLQAALYVLDGHGLLGDPDAVKDATAAPLDPSKVKAGDWAAVEVEPYSGPKYTLAGTVQQVGVSLWIGPIPITMAADNHAKITLTAHQPAPEPEPEWKPGTSGWATVAHLAGGTAVLDMRVMRVEWDGLLGFATQTGRIIEDGSTEWRVYDLMPDEPRPLPTRGELARVMHDDYLPNGEPRLGRTHREILADAVLAHLRGESR